MESTEATHSKVIKKRALPKRGPTEHEKLFFVIVLVFSIMSIGLNIIHHNLVNSVGNHALESHPTLTKREGKKIKKFFAKAREMVENSKHKHHPHKGTTEKIEGQAPLTKNSHSSTNDHSLGNLKCALYGGPDDEIAQREMMYWSDIQSDSEYISPFKRNNDAKGLPTQYMTFEPDGGGFNNIRMAMETVVVMAHAMGRTLVMPPAQGKTIYSFACCRKEMSLSFPTFIFFSV